MLLLDAGIEASACARNSTTSTSRSAVKKFNEKQVQKNKKPEFPSLGEKVLGCENSM